MRVREQMLVIGAFDKVAAELPFALRGVDSDNDSAFMSQSIARAAFQSLPCPLRTVRAAEPAG